MRNVPTKHHYIPQFILRNFICDHDERLVSYYDKETGKVSAQKTSEIFMERNLYRDEINCSDAPVQIENDLSKYEGEVAALIKTKFLDKRKIELTRREDSMLKLFFAIMSFRNINAKEQFSDKASKEFKAFYKYFQENEDLEDFWKRNLGYLVKCRSIQDVANHPEIDPPIKDFMQRDTNGLVGRHIIVVEPKERDGFILGDCYPLIVFGYHRLLPLYDISPISPNRAIIFANAEAVAETRDVLILRQVVFDPPGLSENGNFTIVTKRLLLDEVQFINGEIEKNSCKGFVFSKNKEKGLEFVSER